MKRTGFLLVMLSLFLLVSCEQEEATGPKPQDGRTVDPLRCQNGGEGCDMNWNITKTRHLFPDFIQLLINDKVIYDECERKGNVGITRNVDKVLMTIWDYNRLDGNQDFKMQINDLKDCYSTKEVFYKNAIQTYKVENVNGEKHVQIDI